MAKIQDLQDKTIIILHEKIIESIIKDIVTIINCAMVVFVVTCVIIIIIMALQQSN